jgi:hypothetical protein
MADNVEVAKHRLLQLVAIHTKQCFAEVEAKYRRIVDRNIVCADALTYDYSFREVTEEPFLVF